MVDVQHPEAFCTRLQVGTPHLGDCHVVIAGLFFVIAALQHTGSTTLLSSEEHHEEKGHT